MLDFPSLDMMSKYDVGQTWWLKILGVVLLLTVGHYTDDVRKACSPENLRVATVFSAVTDVLIVATAVVARPRADPWGCEFAQAVSR